MVHSSSSGSEKALRSLVARLSIGSRLPDSREIASQTGTSASTVQKVMGKLAREGQITRIRKRGSFVGAPAAVQAAWNENRTSSGPTDVRGELCSRIEAGSLRAGELLPSFATLASQYGCSKSTVQTVLRGLLDEGVVEKSGRRYAVRCERAQQPSCSHAYVLFCALRYLDITIAYKSDLLSPFFLTFHRELQRASVLQHNFVAGPSTDSMRLGDLQERLHTTISREPGRCLGMSALLRSNRDTGCIAGAIDQVGLPFITYRTETESLLPRGLSHCVQFATREEDLCACLAKAVVAAGHRHVAFVEMPKAPWVVRRRTLLQSALAAASPAASLVVLGHDTVSGMPVDTSDLNDFGPGTRVPYALAYIERMKRRVSTLPSFAQKLIAAGGSEFARSHWSALYLASLLARLTQRPETTALVAASDASARYIEYVLDLAGVQAPSALSLYSFDNLPRFIPNRSSTVDRGQEECGYRGAHFLLRDLPTTVKAGTVIYTRPFMVLRPGSGKPRSGSLALPRGMERLQVES